MQAQQGKKIVILQRGSTPPQSNQRSETTVVKSDPPRAPQPRTNGNKNNLHNPNRNSREFTVTPMSQQKVAPKVQNPPINRQNEAKKPQAEKPAIKPATKPETPIQWAEIVKRPVPQVIKTPEISPAPVVTPKSTPTKSNSKKKAEPLELNLFDLVMKAEKKGRASAGLVNDIPKKAAQPAKKDNKKKGAKENPNRCAGERNIVERGKERVTPKPKKPTKMKKLILEARNQHESPSAEITDSPASAISATRISTPTSTPTSTPKLKQEFVVQPYCEAIITPQLNKVVMTMLQELMKFQNRAKQSSPYKAKANRRLVIGLREVLRSIMNKKSYVVIISYNIEKIEQPGHLPFTTAGGLFETVEIIKSQAKSKGVPIVYALSRIKLGKALGKKLNMSIVSVISTDGAHEHYKEALRLSDMNHTEKYQIDVWLKNNNLSEYGDDQSLVYESDPLVNIKTGMKTERYRYLKGKFQDSPWSTITQEEIEQFKKYLESKSQEEGTSAPEANQNAIIDALLHGTSPLLDEAPIPEQLLPVVEEAPILQQTPPQPPAAPVLPHPVPISIGSEADDTSEIASVNTESSSVQGTEH